MENVIIIAILVVVVGAAAGYVIKAKKSGKKCIGCPNGGSCSASGCSGCAGGAGCSCHTEE